jgi:type I restriction enzyme R subunit
MRDVKSRIYFEQMKGRGSRVTNPTDFNAVTPDAKNKTHFIIVDAVGVCESGKSDIITLERKKGISFGKLLNSIPYARDEDTLTTLAGRLAKLDKELEMKDREEIEKVAEKPMKHLIGDMLEAFDPDKQLEKAKEIFNTKEPSTEQIKKVSQQLVNEACIPFDNPRLRNIILDIQRRSEQIIETVTIDSLIAAEYDQNAKEKSRTIIESFQRFIEDNKDELTALQIKYSNS